VSSIVCEVRYTNQELEKSFFREKKNKKERMREAIICDGTRTVKLTVWGFIIDLLKENCLAQLTNVSSRFYNEELVITTNYSPSVIYLAETLDVEFDESYVSKITPVSSEVQSDTITISCPSIESIRIDNFFSCKICKSKLIVRQFL